ncbi:MAG: VWA domain-containing protein [Desulfobacterales bacterium]|nr:VWA domain-containing protein [Desulfobacterales bacterium]
MTVFFFTILFLLFNCSAEGFDYERINIKCPCGISGNSNIQLRKDAIISALSLYADIDENFEKYRKNKGDYSFVFSNDFTKGDILAARAKASFPKGTLDSLSPQVTIDFLDVFLISEISRNREIVTIQRKKDRREFKIGLGEFEKVFIWYSDLLDKDRAYIPVYGFLSIPADSDELPNSYSSWKGNIWKYYAQSLTNCDFYKILDYQNGYYLLGEDREIFDHEGPKGECGILGWVEEKYVVLWRSRLYYHSTEFVKNNNKNVIYYNVKNDSSPGSEFSGSHIINQFYLTQSYPQKERLKDLLKKETFNNLEKFYLNFGFPNIYPSYTTGKGDYAKVVILGAFTNKVVKEIVKAVKANINAFFLVDISASMAPFKRFVEIFNNKLYSMPGFSFNQFNLYTYRDINVDGKLDIHFDEPDIIIPKELDKIRYASHAGDYDYREPLMGALIKVLERIRYNKNIRKEQIKLLFVITDAGANDKTRQIMSDIVTQAKELALRVIFVIPDQPGTELYNNMTDTPAKAYRDLLSVIEEFEKHDSFTKGVFSKDNLSKSFNEKNDKLLEELDRQIKTLDKKPISLELSVADIVLNFTPDSLLKRICKSDNPAGTYIINHVIKYINNSNDPNLWEKRIAIPERVVRQYLNDITGLSLTDFKKVLIINSFMSVFDIKESLKIYDRLEKILLKNRGGKTY